MSVFQDFRYALRVLQKSPAFVMAAVATLGIGIGANTLIFSVAQAVFLRAMGYPDASRLVFISRGYPGYPQGGGNFTYPAYRDMLQLNTSLDELAAFQSYGALALTDGSEPVRVNINYVTPSYFDLLGAQTALGRTFRREEDRWGDGDPVVVLSHGFWQREFASDPGIVGRVIHFNQQNFTVIGVTSGVFRDAPGAMDTGEAVDAWLPLGLSSRLTGYSSLSDRNSAILWGVGHLKPGVSVQQAEADFASIGQRLAKMYPASDTGFTMVARPLKDQLTGQFYNPVRLLIGASAFILLIGCANVASLLLARLVTRRRELAVRSALGASTARLTRQMMAENLVLLALAAGLGLAIAYLGLQGLHAWGQLNLPSILEFRAGGWLLAGSLFSSLLTLLLFGLGPVLIASRVDLRGALGQGARQGTSLRHRRAGRLLVICEVSLALVLLIGAGLLLASFRRMTQIDLGFNTGSLLTLRCDLGSQKYATPEARNQLTKSLLEKLSGLPGVKSAAIWGPGMPGRATWVIEAIPEGRPPDDPRSIVMSSRHSVNPGALSTMGIPLLRGRDFTWQDDANSTKVAIVSESTAKASWPGEEALGKRFRPIGRSSELITVIGVTSDVRLRQRLDLSDAAIGITPGGLGPQLDVYLPYAQRPNKGVVVLVRIQGDADAATKAIRSAVLAIDPTLTLYDIRMLQERLTSQDSASLALTVVTGSYALLALFLAALGLFSVLAHAVSHRTQELGIRVALGANRSDLLTMVLREGVALTASGIVLGLAGGAVMTRAMRSLLFGVGASDPLVYLSVSALLLAVAATACYLPARRATRVDPIIALRSE